MPKHLTILRCRRSTTIVILSTTIFLFLLIGCASLFRSAGLTDDQVAQQTAALKAALVDATSAAITDIQTGLAEGHDLPTIAVKTGTSFLWKMIAAAGATVGVVLNGLLAKWLGTEKKITKAMIAGVEKANNTDTKETITTIAGAAGIEPQLHARVKALT